MRRPRHQHIPGARSRPRVLARASACCLWARGAAPLCVRPVAILAMRHAACTHMLCRTEYPMHTQDTYDTKHTQNRNRGYRLGLPQRVQVPPLGPLKVWRAFFWLMMRVLIDWFCVKDATCSPSPSVHAQLRQGQRDIPWAPGRCAAREGRRGQDIPAAPATSGACPQGE